MLKNKIILMIFIFIVFFMRWFFLLANVLRLDEGNTDEKMFAIYRHTRQNGNKK